LDIITVAFTSHDFWCIGVFCYFAGRCLVLCISMLWLCTATCLIGVPLCCLLLPAAAVYAAAGDRFRETYYWDSYWVIRGLLVSGMTQSGGRAGERGHGSVQQHWESCAL
jgi:hypothetical protein